MQNAAVVSAGGALAQTGIRRVAFNRYDDPAIGGSSDAKLIGSLTKSPDDVSAL
ncbi:hypothetical protein [Bradyrhizobium sp. USDA 3650]